MSTPFNRDPMPNPPQRSNNTKRFSTYLMVDNQQGRVVLQWIAAPRLRRNVQRYAAHAPHFARLRDAKDLEEQLEQFWINLAVNPPPPQEWEPTNRQELAFQHLASYYETICHQAAKAIACKHSQVSWEEALTIARAFIYNQKKLGDILRKYQIKGSAKLSTYLHEVLTRTIKSETSVGRYSYWRLICQTSEIKLSNALEAAHYRQTEISRILFARKYFINVYVFNRVKGRKGRPGESWPIPQFEDFAETANCYNAERLLPFAPHEVASNPHPVTAKQIQNWMQNCFDAVKEYKNLEYRNLSLDELNAKLGIEIADPTTTIDNFDEPELGEDELTSAWSNQTEEIKQLLETALKRCGSIIEVPLSDGHWLIDETKLLPLKYGFGLTQQQIAVLCGINQCKVSRDLKNKYTKPLVEALTQLSQPKGWVSDYVTEWLHKYFHSPNRADIIQAALVESLKQLTVSERELLSLGYGDKLDFSVIGAHRGCSADEVEAQLALIENQLHNSLLSCIGKWMKEYVHHWLHIFYRTPIKQALIHHLMALPSNIQEALELDYKNPPFPEEMEWDLEQGGSEAFTLVWEGKCQLEEGLIQWATDCLGIVLTGNAERQKINQFVENWLKIFYAFEEGEQDNEI